jgi:hypothetical protein
LPQATRQCSIISNWELSATRGNVWSADVGNKKPKDLKSKKEAAKLILEEIDVQGRLF